MVFYFALLLKILVDIFIKKEYNSLLHKDISLFELSIDARVVKLVDAGDSKSPAARRAGSIPAPGTISIKIGRKSLD